MTNQVLKARFGRRMALLRLSVRKAAADQTPNETAPHQGSLRPVQHQFLQRITLSEDRVIRLTNA